MLEWANRYIVGVAVPFFLVVAGCWFAIYLKAPHIRHPIKLMKEMKRGGGESMRAMLLALGGTLGVGNMVGVSAAIVMGGAGSVLWMCVSALFAMILKYAEIVLAMTHKRFVGEKCKSGAVYYISDILEKVGAVKVGKILSVLFAVFCLLVALSMGGMIQSEAAVGAVENAFGIPSLFVGGAIALLAFFVMKKGKSGIMGVTDKLVPFMTVGFAVLSLAVIIKKREELPRVIGQIFSEAVSPEAAASGIFGYVFSSSVRYGVMRGLISNEAGCGTSPMAHGNGSGRSSAAGQGAFGIVEVFVDTVLLCTMTALVILLDGSYIYSDGKDLIGVTVRAYSSVLGERAEEFMALAVLSFAVATVVCWGYYAIECTEFLFKEKRWTKTILPILYASAIVSVSVYDGDLHWQIADLSLGIMTLINILVLFLGRGEIKRETEQVLGIDRNKIR